MSELVTDYQLACSFGEAPNYQISLWIGGGLEALPDGLQYLKSYVDWRAATDSSVTAPPLRQVWLPEGEVVALRPGN